MKKDTSERGLSPDFDAYMDQLYDPLKRYAKDHLKSQHGMDIPDLNIGVDALGILYGNAQPGFADTSEKMLKEYGNSMSPEAVMLASTLVWVGRYGHDKKPHTDFIEAGPKTAIVYEDRVVKGIKLQFNFKELWAKREWSGVSIDDEKKSASVFVIDRNAVGAAPQFRLESALINLTAKDGALVQYAAELNEGATDSVSGTEFTLNVLPQSAGSPFAVSASWSGSVNTNRSSAFQRTLNVSSVKNVRTPSGSAYIDISTQPTSTVYEYSVRRAKNPWTSKSISEFAGEGMQSGREITGANISTEDGEQLQLVSVRTDSYSMSRAPGTFVELDEYTVDFKTKGKSVKGKRETKRMAMPQVQIYMTLPRSHGKEDLELMQTKIDAVISPISNLLSQAIEINSAKSK